mgnify:CR=1 FL=1
MLEMYSPSGREKKLASFLRDELQNLDFDNVHSDSVGNVYGEVGRGSPTVLLCGHIDTVPGQIPVRIEDGKVFGRGAVDAKSSLAAMISSAPELRLKGLEGRAIIAGVVDEERNARGIRQLLNEQMKIDYAIFGEPSGIANITFAYKGRLAVKIRCRTETGHISAQHLYKNAIELAYGSWTQIREAFDGKKSSHGTFYSATPCLTGIHSPRSSGYIPDECMLTIDVRLPPTFGSGKSIALINSIIDRYRSENPAASVNLEVMDMVEPFVADRNSVLMRALRQSVEEVIQQPPRFAKKTGTGDMNIFGSETGIPVATYGPGDAHLSHTKNECVRLEEYKLSIEVYKKTVEKTILEHHRMKPI